MRVEAPQDTAPGEQNPILSGRSFGYVSPTPLELSTRPLPTARSRLLGVQLKYLLRLVIPVKRHIAKVRHQPVTTPATTNI